MLHGSEGYYVGAREIGTGEQGFGSVGDYIDVGQCKCAGYFAEESGFLVIRFDEREVDVRGPDFQGKSRESGAGTYVEDAGRAVAGCRLPVASRAVSSPGYAEVGRGTGRGRGENSLRRRGWGGGAGVLRLR